MSSFERTMFRNSFFSSGDEKENIIGEAWEFAGEVAMSQR
jgi:hypothetical protein